MSEDKQQFTLEFDKDLIEEIFCEGPEIARMNMKSFLELECNLHLKKLFKMEGYT